MPNYLDKTFCNFYIYCDIGKDCPRALTSVVRQRADRCGLPIGQYMEKPKCFKEVKK